MASHSSSSANLYRLGLLRPSKPSPRSSSSSTRFHFSSHISSNLRLKDLRSNIRVNAYFSRHRLVKVAAMDEDSVASFSLDGYGDSDGSVAYAFSSSEGEESDGDMILNPITDVDLPTTRKRFRQTDDALAVTTHELAVLGRMRKKSRIKYGVFINTGLVTFLTVLILLVDCCAWRIVRLPLPPFHLMRPFSMSAILVSCAGYICVPLFRGLKMKTVIRRRPARHSSKKGTPTMGGLFLIPIGIAVAEVIVGFSSVEVSGAAAATVAFAAIGLVNDFLSLTKSKKGGLVSWIRIMLEAAVGIWFSVWLFTTNISSPYSIKMVVPLPEPVGLVSLGKFYLILTSFCFVSSANGVNLTDGLDGLAGGTAALAFIGMSIAVLPICSDLAVFGASMAGACVGFLFHNRYKSSVFMGDTGSLALGGALAAMASCTGMFFPLLVSSGIFALEALSVLLQVSYFKTTKYLHGTGRRLFRMVPFHHHLELCGLREPIIVAGAYVISSMLMLYGGYVGLISV